MSSSRFVVTRGLHDTVTPTQLYKLLNRYQHKHQLRTQYAALAEILRCANSMERIPADRRAGASVMKDEAQEQSGEHIRRIMREFPDHIDVGHRTIKLNQ